MAKLARQDKCNSFGYLAPLIERPDGEVLFCSTFLTFYGPVHQLSLIAYDTLFLDSSLVHNC